MQEIVVDAKKMLLSGSRRVYKTEGFVFATRKIMSIDAFVSRVAESVFRAGLYSYGTSFTAGTENGEYTLFFRQGATDGRIKSGDLIFYKILSAHSDEGGVDRRLSEYLSAAEEIKLIVRETSDEAPAEDFSKLYLVSSGDGAVNFPLLNPTQRKIVETENANMLVQGVAGSGKTNVCVEKIVYCACRDYRGKILYTTFSRGLLAETKTRVGMFLRNIEDFVEYYESGNVIFLDEHHRQAVENKLGILFSTDDDAKIVDALKRISHFLREKVEYLLIEDIYERYFEKKPVAGEETFLNEYIGDRRSYRLSGALDKIKNLSAEIIYKEIYGMIFGRYEPSAPADMMTREEYVEARRESFSRAECDVIYTVATDYAAFLEKKGYTDNNLMSRALTDKITSPLYSVGIIDEAQDFTQSNLFFIKKASRKLFCVGDALQMINPAYFNFGYVKRLMYGDVTGINELRHNYRSSEKIEKISEALGELNVRRFGTHSFVLKGESVPGAGASSSVFVRSADFAASLGDKRYENVTVVVASRRKKEALRKILGKTEILTVAEAKGLERNTVVLVDVLSDNADKWRYIIDMSLNRKTADENSVFRYYFNLFYVGISRAKQHLFVSEYDYPQIFERLFSDCFEKKTKEAALESLREVAGKIELDDEELTARIERFCELEQYSNARFTADRLSSEETRGEMLTYIDVHERFVRFGRLREAGVEYWRRGYDAKARETFLLSGDRELLPLMDACAAGGGHLDVNVVKFFPHLSDNEIATRLILDTLKNDYNTVMDNQKKINDILKGKRR